MPTLFTPKDQDSFDLIVPISQTNVTGEVIEQLQGQIEKLVSRGQKADPITQDDITIEEIFWEETKAKIQRSKAQIEDLQNNTIPHYWRKVIAALPNWEEFKDWENLKELPLSAYHHLNEKLQFIKKHESIRIRKIWWKIGAITFSIADLVSLYILWSLGLENSDGNLSLGNAFKAVILAFINLCGFCIFKVWLQHMGKAALRAARYGFGIVAILYLLAFGAVFTNVYAPRITDNIYPPAGAPSTLMQQSNPEAVTDAQTNQKADRQMIIDAGLGRESLLRSMWSLSLVLLLMGGGIALVMQEIKELSDTEDDMNVANIYVEDVVNLQVALREFVELELALPILSNHVSQQENLREIQMRIIGFYNGYGLSTAKDIRAEILYFLFLQSDPCKWFNKQLVYLKPILRVKVDEVGEGIAASEIAIQNLKLIETPQKQFEIPLPFEPEISDHANSKNGNGHKAKTKEI